MVVSSDVIRKYSFKSTVKDERLFLRFLLGAFAFFGLEVSRNLAWRREALEWETWVTFLSFAAIISFL